MKFFIGYYNLANTITLLGLATSIMAILCSANGEFAMAVMMLYASGLCDMFDGHIARSLKIQDRKVRVYGINIDSLCDLVSFGVAPAIIAYNMGFDKVLDIVIYLVFVICGAIRLAYFNTQALSQKDLSLKSYTGVPIPFSCVMLPILVLLTSFVQAGTGAWLFRIFFLLTAIAFIINIKIKKLPLKIAVAGMVINLVIVVVLFFRDFNLPA